MKTGWTWRLGLCLAVLSVALGIAFGAWRLGLARALDDIAQRGAADLALASDRVASQLQRYRELAVILADHPVIAELEGGGGEGAATRLLEGVADKTGALDVMYMDRAGAVRVTARGGSLRNLGGQGYAQRALHGALGGGFGTYGTEGRRAYFYAAPRFGADGSVVGAVVVAADIAEIEWDWAGSNPAVFFTDARGRVRITNRGELVGWERPPAGAGLVAPGELAPQLSVRDIGPHEIWEARWGQYLPSQALHLVRPMPVLGLEAEALLDIAPARALARLQAALVLALALMGAATAVVATVRRRTLAEANALLERRVAERTEALARAQAELVQAGKLSALGQMSAGISHELNQPLMAIESYAGNARTHLARGNSDRAGETVAKIADMAQRMSRIIRNLRAFARQESAPAGQVDLRAVLSGALELTRARLRAADVTLDYEAPQGPVLVRGGEVRLGQVFVNLISNAADAMEGQPVRRLSLRVLQGDGTLSVEVADTGPGVVMPDKVFDPFYTTKSVDAGMGLGLSISYGIVQSFGGQIDGRNGPEGAIFTVTLERWAALAEAAE
ncbi:MAG: ATP-binding protein [Pseudomonadota bacterium]